MKTMSKSVEIVERSIPAWMRKCCLARFGTGGLTSQGYWVVQHAAQQVAEIHGEDRMWYDHVGKALLPNGQWAFISEPYTDDRPEACPRWRQFVKFAAVMGLRPEWSAPGSHHPNTVRFTLYPPDGHPFLHIEWLKSERAKCKNLNN